ncbi:MAG: hypothetical protein WA020_01515 [Candidatus Acidiferrales bacterium]
MRLYACALLLIWLQNPTSTPPQHTSGPNKSQSTQQGSNADKRGTQNCAIFVKITPSNQTQEKTSTDQQKRNTEEREETELVTFTKYLAWATGALAAIGLGQLVVFTLQAIQLRRTVEATVGENRPWILLSRETTLPIHPPDKWKFVAIVRNYGKTPAKIVSFHVEHALGDSDTVPPQTSVFDGVRRFDTFVTPPGEPIETWFPFLPQAWAKDEVTMGEKFLWLSGFIQYTGTAERGGRPYETSFCLVYRTARGIRKAYWQKSGPKEYNKST